MIGIFFAKNHQKDESHFAQNVTKGVLIWKDPDS
jgi:hypothetical protein